MQMSAKHNCDFHYYVCFSQWAFCSSTAGQLTHVRNLLGINYKITNLKPGSGLMGNATLKENIFSLKNRHKQQINKF